MLIRITLTFLCLLFVSPSQAEAEQTASDFFKNLSKEKNLLNALYNKNRDKQKQDAKTKPFTLAGEAGLLNTSGNTETSIIKVALESSHELTNWSNRYEAQFLRRTNTIRNNDANETIETSRVQISAQLDYKLLKPENRLFVYVEYDDNEFNFLRDQASLVMGWSQIAWKEDKSDLRYSIGPGYSYLIQERNDTTIEEFIVRGTLFYNIKFSKNARFRQTFAAEMGEEIRKASSQSSVTANIFEKLALKFTIDLNFNESVANQDNTLSTQTSISMVYQFF